MLEVVKDVKKKMGKKLYDEIQKQFPSKNKFYKFCKRHKNTEKSFFDEKLNIFVETNKKAVEEKKVKIEAKQKAQEEKNAKAIARAKEEREAREKAEKEAKIALQAINNPKEVKGSEERTTKESDGSDIENKKEDDVNADNTEVN